MTRFFDFATNMVVGVDSVDNISELCGRLEFGRVVKILCGRKTLGIAAQRIRDTLNASGYAAETIVNEEYATFEAGDKISSSLRSTGTAGLVAVGGGTNIDLGKYAANKAQIPLISVPTVLSSDAVASPYSVLWKEGKPHAVRTGTPQGIIGDLAILKAEPREYISAGLGDQIAKITALHDWKLAHVVNDEPYSEYPAQLAGASLRTLLRNLKSVSQMSEQGIELLFYSMVNDGYLMELAGTTRVAAGSEHLFCFALTDLLKGGSHGHFCGLGTIMMGHLQGKNWRKIKTMLKQIGAPTNAAEANVRRHQVIRGLTRAHLMRDWYTCLGKSGLSEGAAERLAKRTGVIT